MLGLHPVLLLLLLSAGAVGPTKQKLTQVEGNVGRAKRARATSPAVGVAPEALAGEENIPAGAWRSIGDQTLHLQQQLDISKPFHWKAIRAQRETEVAVAEDRVQELVREKQQLDQKVTAAVAGGEKQLQGPRAQAEDAAQAAAAAKDRVKQLEEEISKLRDLAAAHGQQLVTAKKYLAAAQQAAAAARYESAQLKAELQQLQAARQQQPRLLQASQQHLQAWQQRLEAEQHQLLDGQERHQAAQQLLLEQQLELHRQRQQLHEEQQRQKQCCK